MGSSRSSRTDDVTFAASALNAHLNNVRIQNGAYGVFFTATATAIGVNANFRDCQISGATVAGITSRGTGYAAATVFNTQLVGNLGPALQAQGTGTSVIRVGNSSILSNATGISTANAGQVLSFGDNNVSGNSNGETFSGGVLAKK